MVDTEESIALRIETEKLQRAAYVLKAVGHPTRISVIDILGQCERLNVSQIQEYLGVEQALLSHHLTTMRDKGILKTEREGKNIYYSLMDRTIMNIIQCINGCKSF
ncbi:MAG: winged helix-turn-helix transcriptional regulator [Bernardetiaceae bacterium]|nr:winged helix-turn-helix transcriptional regulator [Bernardetiaceae bacterium]